MSSVEHHLRIGELSRRTGVSPELLRAWERRYGLLRPERTSGGFRLYSSADERRIRLMRAALERGVSAAQAAGLALAGEVGDAEPVADGADGGLLEAEAAALESALDALDEGAAQAALDRLLADFTLDAVLAGAVLPYLRRLGERWERGDVSVGHEHFATAIVRARLLALARGWGRGGGRRALLACAPGEQHDLPLVVFGLVLRERGWRIQFLGADTPVATLREIADLVRPELVVVSATLPGRLDQAGPELRELAGGRPLAIAGEGATEDLAHRLGCRVLPGDPVEAAGRA